MTTVPDALSIEYKREYGCAIGQRKLSDIVDYPPIKSEFRRLGLGLSEQSRRILFGDSGVLGDDATNPVLVSVDTV